MPRGIHRQGKPIRGSKRKGSFDRKGRGRHLDGGRNNSWRCRTNDECRGDFVCRKGRCIPPTPNPYDNALSLPDSGPDDGFGYEWCGSAEFPFNNPNYPYCDCGGNLVGYQQYQDQVWEFCDCDGNVNFGCGCNSMSPPC